MAVNLPISQAAKFKNSLLMYQVRKVIMINRMDITQPHIKTKNVLHKYYKYWYFYLLAAPGIIYYLIFKLTPMWGLLFAFQDYMPAKGFLNSKWVGFTNFINLL